MRAISRLLNTSVDLNDVAGGNGYLFVRDGVGVAAQGVIARVSFDSAETFLASIDHDNRTGIDIAPLALGVLPFNPLESAELIIPRVTVGKNEEGQSWITFIATTEDEFPLALTARSPDISPAEIGLTLAAPPAAQAGEFSVTQATSLNTYRSAVLAIRDAVRRGEITKAVIARAIEVHSSTPIDIHAVLLRLKASFAQSYRYSIDGFIGASPELLLSIKGDVVRSHPLAGTTARTGDPLTDERLAEALLSSMKDQVEHRIVIDVIHDQLLPWCSYLDWQAEPSVLQVANVQHLGTLIEGRLTSPHPSLMQLTRGLSPTPALGGHPRQLALDLIATHEGLSRGRYGGAVGWVDGLGNGTWAVAIRCAELSADRRTARLMAGGGIVAESDPDSELAETQAKFQAMLSAIIRP
jgi:menaquinone-specific isochorismate synthase